MSKKSRFDSPDFVFDIVRFGEDQLKSVDFNPFGPTTDPILFSWRELEKIGRKEDDVDFR